MNKSHSAPQRIFLCLAPRWASLRGNMFGNMMKILNKSRANGSCVPVKPSAIQSDHLWDRTTRAHVHTGPSRAAPGNNKDPDTSACRLHLPSGWSTRNVPENRQDAVMDLIWHRWVRSKLSLKAFRIVSRGLVCQPEICVSLKGQKNDRKHFHTSVCFNLNEP